MFIKSFDGPKKGQKLLYSFFTDDCHLRTTLLEAKIWFADPKRFNDPFDCNIPIARIESEEKLSAYYKNQIPNLDLDRYSLMARNQIVNSDNDSNYINKIFQLSLGVRCFSRKCDNILMWSHYTKSHTGVCLTFDITKDKSFFRDEDLLAISYRDGFADFDFVDFGSKSTDKELSEKMMLHYLGIKSKDWRYEQEIRLIKTIYNTSEIYEENTLSNEPFKSLFELTEKTFRSKEKKGLIDRKFSFKKTVTCRNKIWCKLSTKFSWRSS